MDCGCDCCGTGGCDCCGPGCDLCDPQSNMAQGGEGVLGDLWASRLASCCSARVPIDDGIDDEQRALVYDGKRCGIGER